MNASYELFFSRRQRLRNTRLFKYHSKWFPTSKCFPSLCLPTETIPMYSKVVQIDAKITSTKRDTIKILERVRETYYRWWFRRIAYYVHFSLIDAYTSSALFLGCLLSLSDVIFEILNFPYINSKLIFCSGKRVDLYFHNGIAMQRCHLFSGSLKQKIADMMSLGE